MDTDDYSYQDDPRYRPDIQGDLDTIKQTMICLTVVSFFNIFATLCILF